MRAGILTYYGVFNHGAVLQANALKMVIRSMGHECEFVSFHRNYDYIPEGQDRKYNLSIRSVGLYARYLARKGGANTLYNVKKHKILNQYRAEALPLGKRYTDFDGDTVVIGSDEVFSTEIGINPFFYGHGLKADRVFSYGGSFGPTTLEKLRECHLEELVGSGIQKMCAVSTRDQNSADIIKALCNRDATIVCDPVILYGYEQEQCSFVPPERDYILVYSYENNLNEPHEQAAVREYARKHGLRVFSAAYYHGWCDKNIQATPNELLGWIRNAALVVTDTFHGAVLSLVCSTPMVVKLRGNRNKLEFLMQEYGLESRIIDSFADFIPAAEQPLDFAPVNEQILRRRQASVDFLQTALEQGK